MYFVCLYLYITFVYLSITAQCPCNCGTQECWDARRDALFSDDTCSTVGQLDYSNPQNLIAQVKTCLELWERHILYSKKYILRSHFLGHLCHDINRFVSHLVDTIYFAINIPTNRITYSCKFHSVTYVTKYKEAVGIYIDETGSIKYQFSTSVTLCLGRVVKFNPTGEGYNLYSNPDSNTNGHREKYPSSAPYHGKHEANVGSESYAYYLSLLWEARWSFQRELEFYGCTDNWSITATVEYRDAERRLSGEYCDAAARLSATIQVGSKNAKEESGTSEKQEEESQTPRGVACATCGCTGECQQCRYEEFNKINNIPGPQTGAIPKTSGRSSSRGQENKEKKGRRRKKASIRSGGGGASVTPEGGSVQEGAGLQKTRCGKEGSQEGASGTEQEDSNERGAATGGKLELRKEGETEGGDIEAEQREMQGREDADKRGSEGEDSGRDKSGEPGNAGRDQPDNLGLCRDSLSPCKELPVVRSR